MWFDVEKKNYTTYNPFAFEASELWFDVEKKNYTTDSRTPAIPDWLWFDVEKKNYTTKRIRITNCTGCGLM